MSQWLIWPEVIGHSKSTQLTDNLHKKGLKILLAGKATMQASGCIVERLYIANTPADRTVFGGEGAHCRSLYLLAS